MKYRNLAILATSLLFSCNVSDTPTSSPENGASISPRLMLAQGVSLPVTDSVHIKVWSSSPTNVWYEKTLPWSAKFVVISGVPQGTNFLFSIEGRKLQSDSTSAVWWSGNQSGTTSSAQSLDPVDLPVWLTLGDTVSPTISGLKDTILDSAVTGVRLRWSVTDNSLASVWSGSKQLSLTGDVATDTASVALGGSVTVKVRALDNSGNLAVKSVSVTRKAKGSVVASAQPIPWNTAIVYDSIIDSRDGQQYRTVKIGNQKWMAQNLNYSGSTKDTGYCYGNSVDSCTKYGRLYTWAQAMAGGTSSSAVPSGSRGVCPVGWHVPSNAEWDTLANVTGGGSTSGTKLKAKSGFPDYQGASGNGTDDYGFTAVPGNRRQPGGGYQGPMGNAYWWTSQSSGSTQAYRALVGYGVTDLTVSVDPADNGFSLRCVNDTIIGRIAPISKDSVLPQDANTIGLWNFNEGSGASIRNAVTGSTGTLTGGYTWIDGYFGKAILFDGISGFANLNFNPPETNATFEMVTNIQKDTGWLFSLWGAYNSGIAVETNGFISPEFMSVRKVTQPHLNQNIYLALTIDSNKMGRLYVNGYLADSGIAVHSYSWSQTILASYTGSSGFANSSFEKFRISSIVRSEAEIRSIAKAIGLSNSLLK